MSINETDYKIEQKGASKKGNAFGSHKYAGESALRYKLGIDILAGNLVWVGGPYPAGAWWDIKIFMHELPHLLEPGERVEANNGYVGHPNKIKCPNNDCNPEENIAMQARLRSRHETFNARLKFWGILGLGCAFRRNSGGFRRNSDKRHRPEQNLTGTARNRHRNVL
jgi:hypothetical protein